MTISQQPISQQHFVPQIDSKYILNPQLVDIIKKGIENNLRVIIYGPHGSGKSTHIEQVCGQMGRACIRVNLDSNILRSELVGKDTISVENGLQVVSFKEGILPFAMKHGLVLILDEYDSARPETLFVLQKVLEKNGKLFLFEENTEITPHPNFTIFATANTIGQGDESGYYSGTQNINQSNLDRWDIVAKTSYLAEADEIALIKSYFPSIAIVSQISNQIANQIVALANLVRNAFDNGDLSVTFSTRTIISFCKIFELFNQNPQQAFALSYLNRLSDPIETTCATELYQKCFV